MTLMESNFVAPRQLSEEEQRLLESQNLMTEFKRNKLEIEVQKNWDRFYKRHQDHFFRDRHWSKNEFQEIFDGIDLKDNLVFLEAGCGVGNMLFPLAEYFPNWQLHGFDFSSNAIAELRKRAAAENVNVKVSILDLTNTNAVLENFDGADLISVIFVLSAIHPDKHSAAISNLRRFMKPGARIFVRDYAVLDYAMVRFGRGAKIADRFYARQDGTRAFYFYAEEIKKLFEENGFIACRCEYLHKSTTNHEKDMHVNRVFVQGCFQLNC